MSLLPQSPSSSWQPCLGAARVCQYSPAVGPSTRPEVCTLVLSGLCGLWPSSPLSSLEFVDCDLRSPERSGPIEQHCFVLRTKQKDISLGSRVSSRGKVPESSSKAHKWDGMRSEKGPESSQNPLGEFYPKKLGILTGGFVVKTVYVPRASLEVQMVKRPPAVQEIWVQSLGQEYPPGEGNGFPLQYSCLENPMDRGAWQAIQSMGLQRVRHD